MAIFFSLIMHEIEKLIQHLVTKLKKQGALL